MKTSVTRSVCVGFWGSLLCVSCVTLLSHITLHFRLFWSPKVWEFFPHQAVLCDTSWVSYNVIQFWQYLPGDNQIPHGEGPVPQDCSALQMPTAKNRIKDTVQQSDDGINREDLGGSWPQELLPHRAGVHHPPSVDVLTSLEAPWIPYYWDFDGGFLIPAWWNINSIVQPSLLSGRWKVRLKIPSF